jgi:hypothetical protein
MNVLDPTGHGATTHRGGPPMLRWRRPALSVVGALAAVLLPAAGASAAQPPQLHSHATYLLDGGRFLCGDLSLTVVGGSYTEKIHAVVVNGLVHYNLVRTYSGVRLVGSDGGAYRATATAHESALVAMDTEEPISVREVIQVTFSAATGLNAGQPPGYVHEVLTVADGIETVTDSGPCRFLDG